jgi:hypothetical protein
MQQPQFPSDQSTMKDFGVSFGKMSTPKLESNSYSSDPADEMFSPNPDSSTYKNPATQYKEKAEKELILQSNTDNIRYDLGMKDTGIYEPTWNYIFFPQANGRVSFNLTTLKQRRLAKLVTFYMNLSMSTDRDGMLDSSTPPISNFTLPVWFELSFGIFPFSPLAGTKLLNLQIGTLTWNNDAFAFTSDIPSQTFDLLSTIPIRGVAGNPSEFQDFNNSNITNYNNRITKDQLNEILYNNVLPLKAFIGYDSSSLSGDNLTFLQNNGNLQFFRGNLLFQYYGFFTQ